MKAAVFHGPSDVRIESVPEPEPNDANIIIKIHRASICNGSDSAVLKGERDIIRAHPELQFPMIGGHECAGEITHVGRFVEGYSVGERIAYWCKAEGAFGEYTDLYPSRYAIVKLSDNVSWDEGSIMEMLGSTMQRGTRVELGETVVVFGLGPAGLLLLQEAKISGALEVVGVDLHRNRLDKAVELGADLVIDASSEDVVQAIRQRYGRVDDVVYATGKDIFDTPLEVIHDGGKLIMYGCVDKGITFDANYCLYHAIDMVGFGGCTLDDIRRLMHRGERLVAAGRLKIAPLITHHIPIEDIAWGLDMVANHPDECIKIVIDIA